MGTVRSDITLLMIAMILSACPMVRCEEGKRDPETGKIRLLYIGDATHTRNPVFIYKSDPTFTPTLIPSCRDVLFAAGLGMDDVHRYMRQYMPKNFDQMKDSYDSFILSDVCVLNFRLDQIDWIGACVREHGFGLVMVGGVESFGGGSNYPSWAGTAVAGALPVEFGDTYDNAPSGSYFLKVSSPGNELIRSLPWESAPPFSGLNVVTVRDGGTEIAEAASMLRQYPLMAEWIYGEGRSIAFTPDWTPGWGGEFCRWEYYLDFASNIGLYESRIAVPMDLARVHANRAEFYALSSRKTLLTSLFEFVDRFGANTARLEERVAKVDEKIHSAEEEYVVQEYDESLGLLAEARELIQQIEADALMLKDRAMMWIYIIEWFVVLGTSFACGTILWVVMVKRRLYREVRITRAR